VLVSAMVGTFVALRAWLAISPNADLTVGGFNVHHLFTGILVAMAAGIPLVLRVVRRERRRPLIAAFGVGVALMLDEWVYLVVTDGSNAAYLTPVSFWGGVVTVGIGGTYAWWCARASRRL
jgi:hypothetical protein